MNDTVVLATTIYVDTQKSIYGKGDNCCCNTSVDQNTQDFKI